MRSKATPSFGRLWLAMTLNPRWSPPSPQAERGGNRAAWQTLVDIGRIGPLVQLDVGAPRVGDEGERSAGLFVLRVGPIEFDAVGFKLLDEGLQVLHVEADVVEDAPLGGGLRHLGLVEAQLRTGHVRDRGVVAQAGLGAKNLA